MPHFTDTVSLKRPKKTKKERDKDFGIASPDEERFPYGTSLHFENEEIQKLPMLKKVKAGDDLVIYAKASVTRTATSENVEGEPGEQFDVNIQLTDISIHDANDAEEAFNEGGKK